MKPVSPSTTCRNCIHKKLARSTTCPFQRKDMCPVWQASVATMALEWKDAVEYIPLDAILTALRFHGYSGELRKTSTVII